MLRLSTLTLLIVLGSQPFFGQTPPASDPQALTLAAQSVAAMTGGSTITDVTLSGNATWIVGSDTQTGTARFMALGTDESRFDVTLPNGTRTEIRDASTGFKQGKWISVDGSSGLFGFVNCFTDAAWFFPVLGSLSGPQNTVLSYVGQETRDGAAVQHLQSYLYQTSAVPTSGPSLQKLSTMNFYLDATTLLPVAITFSVYPDNSETATMPVEIDFSNYQALNGVTVPLHIQKFSEGNLALDFQVSSAAFNTGLQISTFAIN
ncbi:MAG TPA: hypothetical protein VMB19_15340 [Silvibacterium sp.]|nr:hypothetical protein [Silvibacterium sp.]